MLKTLLDEIEQLKQILSVKDSTQTHMLDLVNQVQRMSGEHFNDGIDAMQTGSASS